MKYEYKEKKRKAVEIHFAAQNNRHQNSHYPSKKLEILDTEYQ